MHEEDLESGDFEISPSSSIDRIHTTRGLQEQDLVPGDLLPDGSYIDAYGEKHYSSGVKYAYAKQDRRVTKNGAYSGNYKGLKASAEEKALNPFLGLSPQEYDTLNLYMQGLSRNQIANVLGISPQTIYERLGQPHVRECILRLRASAGDDLHALVSEATQVLRDSMSSEEAIETRLKGASQVFKVTGYSTGTANAPKPESAASQMQRVLEMLQVNVQVNLPAEGSNE